MDKPAGWLWVNKLAEEKFFDADTDGDGKLSPEEIGSTIMKMLVELQIVRNDTERDSTALSEFLQTERALAMKHDRNYDGHLDFEEFVSYYNTFVDKVDFDAAGHLDPRKLRGVFAEDEARLARAEDVVQNELGFGDVKPHLAAAEANIKKVDESIQQSIEELQGGMEEMEESLLEYEDFREHGAKWSAARDEMRARVFASGDAVLRYVINTIQSNYVDHGAQDAHGHATSTELCGVVVLMLREVGLGAGRLWTKMATKTEQFQEDGALAGRFTRGELWSPKETDPLTVAVYEALRSKVRTATRTQEGHFLVHPLTQLDGHVYGVILNGPSPAPEGVFFMMVSAAGPVFERAHRFAELKAGIEDVRVHG